MSGISNVVIKIGAETASAVREIRSVDKALDDTRSTGSKMQGAIQNAAVPAAAALTALTGAAVLSAKAAAEDAASKEQLDSQIRRSTGATREAIDANEKFIDTMMEQTAIADDELRPAMANLVRTTNDVHKAQGLLKLSADLAAASGKPLASTSAAVAKAYRGSTGALKKLVPGLSDAALESGKWKDVQKELNKQVGGAAVKSAGTAAGKYKKMQNSMGELQESIGAGLLPILDSALPVLTKFADAAGGHPNVVLALAGAIAAVAAAVLIANAAISINTALVDLNVAAHLKSFAGWVAETAAMIAYNAIAVVNAARTIAMTVAQWLLNAALSANPIGLIIIAIAALVGGLVLAYKRSATFRSIVQSAFKVAKDNAILLLGPIGLIIKAFQLLYQKSGTVREGVKKAMEIIHAAIKLVLDAVNALVDAISHIHVPDIPSIPGLNSTALAAPSSRTTGTGGPVVNVNISGAVDPESTALAIRRVLERYDRRRGRRPLGGSGAR